MQVFLPSPNFQLSVHMLDNARLRKQRVEAFQLLNVITGRVDKKGWKNHPAAVMFRQYVPALQLYYNYTLEVNSERGGNNIKLKPETITDPIIMPHWIGDDSIHRTHRSRLLMKGKVDILADRIRIYNGGRCSVNRWLQNHGWPTLNEIRQPEYEDVSNHLNDIGAPHSGLQNHYSKFGWSEPDTLEYLWPGEFPGSPNKLLR